MSQTVTIYVNTKSKTVAKTDLTFDEIVSLAYDGNPPTGPDWSFTVSYHKGHARSRRARCTRAAPSKSRTG